MAHADSAMLILDDGSRWGPFTSHWAACAAMIRLSDPTFRSTGGDKAIDLCVEKEIAAYLKEGSTHADPR